MPKILGALIWTAALVVAVVLVLLGLQNRELKNSVAKLEYESGIPRVGAQLPTVAMTSTTGKSIRFADTSGPTQFLFYFTTECPYAISSMPYVREVAASARRLGLEFVGVTNEKNASALERFISAHKIDFPVVVMADDRLRRQFDFRISPTVFVVGPSGQTVAQHVGQFRTNKEVSDLAVAAARMDASAVAAKERVP